MDSAVLQKDAAVRLPFHGLMCNWVELEVTRVKKSSLTWEYWQ